ncbi:MAG TPA: S8 family serine peptidase, partial [Candidatus Thermoplasmatota archaeon]|nr:S8 family serine peptidase [Candidatus Thermoplasmatota archaeon]
MVVLLALLLTPASAAGLAFPPAAGDAAPALAPVEGILPLPPPDPTILALDDDARLLRLPDGRTMRLDVPYPVHVAGEGEDMRVLVSFPREAGRRMDPRLLDPVALADQGVLRADGRVEVVVRAPLDAVAPHLEEIAPFARLGLVAGALPYAQLARLAVAPGVERVYPDARMEPLLDQSVPLVRAPEAHARTDALARPLRGTGVVIAIIDTGVDATHPDLGGCFGAGCRVAGGYDFVDDDAFPEDTHGHGTHVAATAAGTHGVAPDATILAYRVCGNFGCETEDILAAIENATLAGADIISMSLGGPGTSDGPLATSVDWAVAQGVVVVSAAGNAGPGDATIGEPAASRRGIAVGATTKTDALASFSSRGPVYDAEGRVSAIKPDLVAPGVDITAAVPTGSCPLCRPSGYVTISGTSMATPHVSGAAALLLQAHPGWTPEDVKAALVAGAVPVGNRAHEEGAGRLDVIGGLDAALVIDPGLEFLGYLGMEGALSVTRELRVRNLGASTLEVSLAALPTSFTASVAPSAITLAPGASATVTFEAHADAASLPEGWHEAAVRASSGPATATARLELLHAPLLRLHFDALTRASFVWRDGSLFTLLEYPPATVTLPAPPGVYDAVTLHAGCPQEPCGSHTRRMSVLDDFLHSGDGDAWFNATDAAHRVAMVARTVEGVALPEDLPDCSSSVDDLCYGQWYTKFQRVDRCCIGLLTLSWGTNQPVWIEGVPPTWAWGRHQGYRALNTTYHVGRAVHGIAGDVTLDTPLDALVPELRYHTIPQGKTDARRIDFCMGEVIVPGHAMAVHEGELEPILVAVDGAVAPTRETLVPCARLLTHLRSGTPDSIGRCLPPECTTFGDSVSLVVAEGLRPRRHCW